MSVAWPGNVIDLKNGDNETRFHVRSPPYLIIIFIIIFIDSQPRLLRDCG